MKGINKGKYWYSGGLGALAVGIVAYFIQEKLAIFSTDIFLLIPIEAFVFSIADFFGRWLFASLFHYRMPEIYYFVFDVVPYIPFGVVGGQLYFWMKNPGAYVSSRLFTRLIVFLMVLFYIFITVVSFLLRMAIVIRGL